MFKYPKKQNDVAPQQPTFGQSDDLSPWGAPPQQPVMGGSDLGVGTFGEPEPTGYEEPVAPVAPAKGKAAAKTTKKADALREMPEVTTLADAATVLTAEGAPAADFDGTVEGALKIAKGLGLSFPNLKAE